MDRTNFRSPLKLFPGNKNVKKGKHIGCYVITLDRLSCMLVFR
ncbi:Uncharacterized protein APZ42_004270 [Daphnia magna]|uniref:Uncharacterized protein n=1 Tax=Daphnia magna TaxID=35525 RepID=A0A162C109_9CRUS|nr:Uncharacterized protein APZ42_004270 [Daphnia magna]